MHPRLVMTLLAALLCFASPLPAADGDLEDLEEQAFKEAAALVEPSIVRIETVGGLDRVGEVLANDGPTTGLVVGADGYVISSSFNFINKPDAITVLLPDGRRLPAKVVSTDHSKMLTLLKIEADGLIPPEAASKKDLKVGQWALAMGRTFDESLPSVSVGIVSALNRIWGKAVQTDAKTSPVNYGGPLVDVEGKVIGVIVPLSPQGDDEAAGVEWYDGGIGFAVPLEDVYRVLDRMKSGEDLKAGLMGIAFKAGAGVLGSDNVIDTVRVNSPADQAGLKKGDVIVSVNGHPTGRDADVKHALGSLYAGDKVKVTVQRGEEELTKELTLAAELTPYESGFLGILPDRLGGPGEEAGVGVRYVFADSPAAKLGLAVRDRVTKFNGQPVADAKSLADLVIRILPGEKASITWTSGGKEQTGEVEIAAVPNDIPAELRSSPIPPPAEALPEDDPKTGHFSDTIADGEMSYWAYVPESYNPAYAYSLMVWIHPADDTMEAALLRKWRPVCQQRGVILLAPRAENISRWNLNETAVVKQLVEQFREDYSIDPRRVSAHSLAESGAFAGQLAFKYRDQFRGLCLVGSPVRGRPPENDPETPLQFQLVVGSGDEQLKKAVDASAEALRKMKFPVGVSVVEDLEAGQYPEEAATEEIARWIDMLDRI
jgi:serine protease Do